MSLQKQASLSNLASSPSGPPLSVGQCIEILKKGGALLKCGRKGDPHFRKFRVTEDLKVLSWESPNKKSKEATVTLSEVTEIRLGQKTKVFSNNKVPEYEHISFSLLYGERSLDLVCKDKREFDIWVAGLKALTVEPALFALSARSSVNEMRTSVNGLPRSDSLDVVVRGKSTVIVKYEEGSDVYSWGQGTNGRLGHGDEGDQLAPKVIEALLGKDVRAAACGSAHSIAVTAHGDVYTWGAGAYGRLGHGHERDRFTPLQVSALRGKMIIMVAAGDMHTLALAENGEVHVWGRGADGRLGLGDDQSNQLIPRQIEVLDDKRICFIAAGYKTSAAVSLEGDLYTWGGNDKGQLGHGDLVTGTTPNPITSLKGVITQVQLASWHSAAVDIDGNVYTWGDGSNGKLGHGDEAEQLMPKKVTALNGQKVVQIACGDFHTAVLIDSGAVFTWGEGNYGQLGHGPAVSQYSKPLQVGKPLDGNKVTQIAAGSNITAALTSNGLVYTWGYATNGRLGHGDEDDQQIPRLVESMKGKSVQQISCGGAHMLATVTHGWVPDQESPQCMACKTMFTFVRRRHHCRNCGGIFCGSCSAKRFPILKTGSHEPVRVCDKCYSTLSSVK